MTRVSRTRLARLRSDTTCPHCEVDLTAPVVPKPTDEELAAIALESLRKLPDPHAEAAEKSPTDRTFGDWAYIVDFSYNVRGAELVDQLTRLRDEVAAGVGG